MSRKYLTLLVVLVMTALLVAACGGASTTSSDANTGGSDASTSQEAETEQAQPSGGTLQVVLDRDSLACGVNQAVPGFGFLQADGSFAGFDVDFCKALATST